MARPKKEKEVKQESLETQLWKSADKLRTHLARTPGTIAFNDAVAGIEKLRRLHTEMDNAVLEAPGWAGLDLRHDFYEEDYLPETDRTRYTLHPAARRRIVGEAGEAGKATGRADWAGVVRAEKWILNGMGY